MKTIPARTRATRAITTVSLLLLAAWFLNGDATAAQDSAGVIQQRIDRVETKLLAQEGIRAVKRLQHTYAHYLELGLWSDLGDLFSENAVARFQANSVAGKAAIRKLFMDRAERTSLGLVEGQLNAHFALQPIINLAADGKTILGTWHEVTMKGNFGSKTPSGATWSGGIYENEYVQENGVWKISKLRYHHQYDGAYEDFGHKAPPQWGVPYHFKGTTLGVTLPQTGLQSAAYPLSKGTPGVRLADLAERAQRMNEETEVQNLQHTYGYYIERKLWDDAADLFADDGTLEEGQRGVYVGRTRIRRALETFHGPAPLRYGELFDHINLSTVVTIAPDGKSAGARTTQLKMVGVNGEYARWEEGTYENEFVKGERDGVWRIKAVRYYPRVISDYEKGWGKDAKPVPTESKEFPADRRPTQPYEAYPKNHIVSLHYANPVTGKAVQYPSGPATRVQVVKSSTTTSRSSASADAAGLEPLLAQAERRLDAAIGVDAVENLNSSYGYYLDESAWDDMADTFASTTGAKEITGAGVYVGRERIRAVLNLRGPRGGRSTTSFTIHQLTHPVIHISEDGNSAKARVRLYQLGGSANGSSGSWIGGIYENTAVKENGEWKFGVQDLHHTFNASYRNGWAKYGAARGAGATTPTTAATRGAATTRPATPSLATSAAPSATSSLAPTATSPAGITPSTAPAAGQANAPQGARGTPARGAAGGGLQQGIGGARGGNSIASQMPPDRAIRARQYAFPEIVEPAFHYKNPVSGRMPKDLLP